MATFRRHHTLFMHPARVAALWLCALLCLQNVDTRAQANAAAAPPPSSAAAFQQQLDRLAANEHTCIGIAIRDLATGEEFSVKGDTSFSQTGLTKLHILIALYREANAGRIDLASRHTLSNKDKLPGGILHRLGEDSVSMSLRDYAMLMGIMDDNSAANVLLGRIGTQAINNYLATLDTPDIRFVGLVTDPKNPDDNTATPRALALCLARLYEGKIVDLKLRDDIFEILGTPRVSSLRSGIPATVKVASKAGFRGQLRCSAGIVFLPKHPYAIIIMMRPVSEQSPHQDPGLGEIIASLSRLTYAHFSGVEKNTGDPSAPAAHSPQSTVTSE